MRKVLFTHNDLDGIGCAILGTLIGIEKDDIHICTITNVNRAVRNFIRSEENMTNVECVYITDLSVNKDVAAEIDAINEQCGNKPKIKLFDHHETALWLNKYRWAKVMIYTDSGRKTSGTVLFYTELLPMLIDNSKINLFVELVRLRDTWEWKTAGSSQGEAANDLNALFEIYGIKKFIDMMVDRINDKSVTPLMTKEDRTILDIEKLRKQRYIRGKANTMTIRKCGDYTIGIVFTDRYVSETGSYLLERYSGKKSKDGSTEDPCIDIAAMIMFSSDLKKQHHIEVSLRSNRPEVHVGEFAAKFGGGGHQYAAGFQVYGDIVDDLINKIFSNATI